MSEQEKSAEIWRRWVTGTLLPQLREERGKISADSPLQSLFDLAIHCWTGLQSQTEEERAPEVVQLLGDFLSKMWESVDEANIVLCAFYTHRAEDFLLAEQGTQPALSEESLTILERCVSLLRRTWKYEALSALREAAGQPFMDSLVIAACHIMLRHFRYSLDINHMEDCLADLVFILAVGRPASEDLWGDSWNRCPLGHLITSSVSFEESQAPFLGLASSKSENIDWERVAHHCEEVLQFSIYNQYNSWLYWGSGEIEDTVFWSAATAQAKARLSPDAYRRLREQDEAAASSKRLKQYFFPDTWDLLPQIAQQNLIAADRTLWATEGWRYGIFEHLRLSVEPVVDEILGNPFREWLVKNGGRAIVPPSNQAGTQEYEAFMPISRLIQELWVDKKEAFARFVATTFPNVRKEWWEYLESSLKALRDLRRRGVHPEDQGQPMEQSVANLYAVFLGIGQEGILPRLMQMKRDAQKQGQ
ncbi:MAG: hypothetical protein HY532_04565 [Chloroflexi bacterium]|nr:hypothetical protein [Chloroflexota bacterium]